MPKILERLRSQLAAKGVKNAIGMAEALLRKHGILNSKGKLTAKGKVRNAMSPEQRAKSRQAKYEKKHPVSFRYSKKTNRARLK